MKIGIYGGTFNPPHLGHQAAADTAIKQLGLDKLILIPAAIPPHKELPQSTPDSKHRLEMTRKMADALDAPGIVEVSDMEMTREGDQTLRQRCELLQKHRERVIERVAEMQRHLEKVNCKYDHFSRMLDEYERKRFTDGPECDNIIPHNE